MLTIELADVMLPGISDVTLNKNDDLIFLTVGMYKLFLSRQGGRDARDLYLHLMFTARLQETNQVWANKTYLKEGLFLGDARLKRAKALLKKLGLIEYVKERGGRGRLSKVYIRLTKLWSWGTLADRTTGSVSEPVVESPILPQGRFTTPLVPGPRNALSEKENKRVEQPSVAQAKPTASPSPAKNKGPRTPHGRVRALYGELYRKNTRAASAPFNKACAGQLRNDLVRLGEDRLARCIRWLFEHPPARMQSFSYMSLHTFLPEAEKAQATEDRRLSMVRVCPHCGKRQEHTGADCLYCRQPLNGAQHVG